MNKEAEKRKRQRKDSDFKSVYPIVLFKDPTGFSNADTRKAKVVDVSEDGMGLFVEDPLPIGREIVFARQHNWKLPKSAVVIWTVRHGQGYRAGIKFS